MPSKTGKQHRLMELIAHGGKPRSGKGPPPQVARDFVNADRGRHFRDTPTVKPAFMRRNYG